MAGPASVLGPTFSLRFGALFDEFGKPKVSGRAFVRHRNNLTSPPPFGNPMTTVHLHGAHLMAGADGFPDNLTNRPAGFPERVVNAPGESLVHAYPLLDPGFETDIKAGRPHGDTGETPSTLWYHGHFLEWTGPNVYSGLVGIFRVFDRVDENQREGKTAYDIGDEVKARSLGPPFLPLPSDPYDIPLVLQDKRFNKDGSLFFDPLDKRGFLGDKYLVNGAIQPYLNVKPRKYRFRFLNGSNARVYQIFLANANGAKLPMTQIATEGGLLSMPLNITQSGFSISMAERVEVVIDFSIYKPGSKLYLENRRVQTDGAHPAQQLASRGPQIMQFVVVPFDVGEVAEDPSIVPSVLRPFAKISDAELNDAYTRFKRFDFDDDHGNWVINGKLADDLEQPIRTVALGKGEIWRLVNKDDKWWHPLHIHSDYFRVIKRKNIATNHLPPLFERDGVAKKDTILLRDNDWVEVFVKFTDHPGPWVMHCHNLEHEDMAMMARFDTTGPLI
jgi:FtsP/CotA-like multicopper oxidase with cupredoxin domain